VNSGSSDGPSQPATAPTDIIIEARRRRTKEKMLMLAFRTRTVGVLATMLLSTTVTMAAIVAPETASPIYGVQLPEDYRQWQVISVAHEAGNLNDIRVILGNELAVETYRSGRRPFPDGAILARVAWKLVPSARNNAIFGQPQSFVAGDPTNVQIEVKDSRSLPRPVGGDTVSSRMAGQILTRRSSGHVIAAIRSCRRSMTLSSRTTLLESFWSPVLAAKEEFGTLRFFDWLTRQWVR
jgi:hypothetical protein